MFPRKVDLEYLESSYYTRVRSFATRNFLVLEWALFFFGRQNAIVSSKRFFTLAN